MNSEREILGPPIPTGILFVGGIHGVGKSTFCRHFSQLHRIPHYSCSTIIEQTKNIKFSENKQTHDVCGNQRDLINAIELIKQLNGNFLLDGHFCLRDVNGNINEIETDVFKNIMPSVIIILEAEPADILKRRPEMGMSLEEIEQFLKKETTRALEISDALNVPIYRAALSDCGNTYSFSPINKG